MDFIFTYLTGALTDPLLFFSISFVALLFLGEPVILSIALLCATTTLISPDVLIVLAITSAVVAECFWFFVGTSILTRQVLEKGFIEHGFHELQVLREKMNITHPLALLFVTRPFTGLTIIAILLLGKQKLSWGRFLLSSFVVNIFWTPLVVGIGYATGLGYTWALALFESVHFGLGAALILLIVVYIVYKYATQKLTHIALDTSGS